jgi:hypothetical protein
MVRDGQRKRLLELVLTASFRPERHGLLLMREPLPVELPVPRREGDDRTAEAWAELVALQAGYREMGLCDPWAFWSSVRRLHAVMHVDGTAAARARIKQALVLGPWKFSLDGRPVGEPAFSDAVLREAWEGWACREPASHNFPRWCDCDYAVQRFVEGLEPVEAYAAMREAARAAVLEERGD